MEQSNLTFEEFKGQVKDNILRYLPEAYGGLMLPSMKFLRITIQSFPVF